MTDTNPPSGEARARARRNAFYRYVGLTFLVSLLVGIVSGRLVGYYESGAIPLWVPLLAIAAVVLAMIWFTRDYFRRIDELDLMDNLWAHLVGLYGGVIVFGVWYFIAELGLVEHPEAFAIIGSMILIVFLAYAARKLGWR